MGRMVILLLISFLLASCAGVNSQFGCNKVGGKGVGCASLDTVNQMADAGAFNGSDPLPSTVRDNTPAPDPMMTGYQGVTPSAGEPLRYGESVQNIWIAPFVDTTGNYHWPQMVSVVVQKGHWVGEPVAAIQASAE